MVKKNNGFEEIGDSEIWEEDDKLSTAQILKNKKTNKLGITVKVGKKAPWMNRPSGFWIDDKIDLNSWLYWFGKTIRKLYYNLTGKEIPIDQKANDLQNQVDFLIKSLADTKKELEETKKLQIEQQAMLELARKSIDSLDKFKPTFEDFKRIIQDSFNKDEGKEEEIKNKIKAENWLLGLDCFVDAKNINVDNQTQIDLHVKTKYGQDKIFEIKSPNLNPFVKKDNKKTQRLTISDKLAEGLSELILYMKRTDFYSNLNTLGTYGIPKASGIIIIGYNLDKEQKEMLSELNFHLRPHIEIVTFNDLINTITNEINLIERIKDQTK